VRVPEASLLRVRAGARTDTQLCRLAVGLAGISGWRRYGLAFLLGIAAAAAMPPTDLAPLLAVAFPGLLWLDDGSTTPAASFALGCAFGFGFFLAGLYWIAAALFVDIARFWWLVPFAVAGLPALFALYVGLALLAVHLAARYLRLPATARVFAFAVAWSVAEWVRGHALTGFPWNLVGYAWSGGFPGAIALLQSVAWVGIYGLSFATVLAASLPALLGVASPAPISALRRCAPAIGAGLLLLGPAAAGALRLERSPAADSAIWLRIVQPSIAQSLKWDPAAAAMNFRRLLVLSTAPAPHPVAAILWPEAAVPFFLGRDPAARREIATVVPPRGYLITGALRANPPPEPVEKVWNSLEAINADGEIVAHYDKVHLVPFGEYVPLRKFLPVEKITAGTIDLSAGRGPRTLALPGLPPFAPLICYEAIFPGAVFDEARRPDWILNITNDAWYGRSSGPFQHFAIARTRTVEEGLPLVRVANNGVSGVVDALGRVPARINLDAVGYADVALPAPAEPTLYARAGDWMLLACLLLGAIPIVLRLY
jgi:apolipoprotein N-acyltransferase